MSGVRWYDRQGRPIGMEEAERLLADPARLLARTEFGSRTVSTVHLVLDHSLGMEGPPLIFETMVFPECDVCVRTPTEAAALAMHDQVCAELREEVHHQ